MYDPLGRRIAKSINGVIVKKYLWQGTTKLLAVYDGSGNLIQRFEYADGRLPVAMTMAGVRYFLAYDQVGTLRAVTDGAGNIVKQIDYDSFGNVISDSDSSLTVPLGFAGGLYDPDTGLVRFGKRDYDPDTGRWTAKDPIGFAGGDTDLYGYCLNDPVSGIDPYGEFVQIIGGLVGGAIAGGVVGAVIGFASTYVTSGGNLKAALKGATTGLVGGAIVGGIAGGLTAAGLPTLGLEAAELAGSSFFGQGFVAGFWSGYSESVAGPLGSAVGAIGSILGPPVIPAYGAALGNPCGS